MIPFYYDLHIHSCLSPCADDDMTPNNIAGMASLKKLQIAALTDHNSCKNCPSFFEACGRYGIIPVAGMELSTAEDIHIVCLFENLGDAMKFDGVIYNHLSAIENRKEIFGNQVILNGNDEPLGEEKKLLISATDLWLGEAVELARKFGAFVYPAHIDREANGILAVLGAIPNEYGFKCMEFKSFESISKLKLKYGEVENAVSVVSSDAHHLWDINEAEHCFFAKEATYDATIVRKRLFEYLNGRH